MPPPLPPGQRCLGLYDGGTRESVASIVRPGKPLRAYYLTPTSYQRIRRLIVRQGHNLLLTPTWSFPKSPPVD